MTDVPLTQEQIAEAEQRAGHESYPHEVLVAFDQFINMAGDKVWGTSSIPAETISAHVRRVVDDPTAKHKLIAKVLNTMLDHIQKNHGALAQAGDLERAKEVTATEDKSLGVPPSAS